MNIVEAVILSSTKKARWPSKDDVRHFHGNFGGIIVNGLSYNPFRNILFTPAYVTEPPASRANIRKIYRDSGFRHFPINLYNTTSIYHNYYPDWNDALINDYLLELLRDGLIPIGSAFADNIKTIKPVVDP